MNIFIISTFCFGFSSFLLGLMIYLKRKDRVGKLWFIFSVFCTLWATGYAFQINNAVDYQRALWASRFADAAAIFIPVAWLRFIYEFLGLRINKKMFLSIYFLSFVLLLTAPFPFFIKGLKNKSHIGFEHFVDGGIAFHIFAVLFAIAVIYAFFLIVRAYFQKNIFSERKNQIKYLFLAAAIGFAGGGTAFLPAYDIDLPVGYGTLLMPLFPFIMAFAMTRYRLLDTEEIAQAVHRDKLAAIGTLTTSINHEIKNPLYIIQGLSESYLSNLEDNTYATKEEAFEKSREILQKTAEQARRAMDIMKNFAVFAKQSIHQNPQVDEVRLSRTMNNVLPLVQHELELDRIELVQDVSDKLLPFKADERQVEQILFNLIVNACQAMKSRSKEAEKQEAKIEISAERQNGHINIMVKDNGPGIPEEQIKKIFEPFFTTKQEGTGLGLYITKQLVERNGGKISVRSTVGHGTTFHLEFKR